ncbi:MAG: SHD1 domain-containing protein [Pirellulaceae bacterium]
MSRSPTVRCLAVLFVLGYCGVSGPLAAAREWTDPSGKFRIQAELVAIRGDKVVLEKADGTILSVPLNKLSAADQAFLKAQAAPKPAAPAPLPAPAVPSGLPATAPQPAAPPTADGLALSKHAESVLRTNCYRCHGEDGTSEGGFNFVLNLEKLTRTLVKPRNPAGSLLFERLTATDDSRMPPAGEDPLPSPADIAVVKAWIEAGAPAVSTSKPREFVTSEQVVKLILADMNKTSERSRRFVRYFTLTHLYNAGVSEDELQTYRNAFVKLINSLSWNTELLVPPAIDPAKTVFRVDIRQLNWSSQVWQEIEAANPYFLALNTPDALACYEMAETKMPYVRVDWFVFAASKPPLYHTVLSIPETDGELEQMLRVNVQANIEQEQTIRAAFNRSGVSQNNRLIEWHKSPYGSYWKSYDFGGNVGQQNLFEYPLGPSTEGDSFRHDGGEMIFTLPNGLQGYLLADEAGKRIDQGPTSIVSDPKRPDRTVTNGVSCMSCHYTGVIPKMDEVGGAVRANPKAFDNADDILALYRDPKELGEVFDNDARRFAQALNKLGIKGLSRSGEPISAMAMRFEQELDLPLTASEFGLPPAEFVKKLDMSDAMSRTFAALRVPGGTIKRDLFVNVFGQAAIEFRLVTEGEVNFASSAAALPEKMPARSSARTSARSSAKSSASLPATEGGRPGELRRFDDLTWGVHSLAFSPSGGQLVAGKPDREIRVFDIANGAQLESVDKLEMLQSVKSCLYTPNGSRLLAAGSTGHILIFEAAKDGRLKELAQFAGHTGDVLCMAVSGDGRFALSGGQEKKLRYWDIAGSRELAAFAEFEGPVKACHHSRGGRTALATDGGTLLEIDLSRKQVTRRTKLTGSWASGQAAAISADGKFVAVGDSYNIRLWNLQTLKELPMLEGNEIQWSMAFTPDGSRLLSGGNAKVNVWDVRKQQKIHSQSVGDNGYVQCLAASPDNKHAAAIASRDVVVFRLPGGR